MNSYDHTSDAQAPASKNGPRLQIDLSEPLYRKADLAWHALMETNDADEPRVLVRGNELVRMTERGDLEPFVVDNLTDLLSRAAQFNQSPQGGSRAVDPPSSVVRALLARDSGEYMDAPRVDRVVDVPVLTADGSLLERPGHHAGSKLYYRPADGLEHLRQPDRLTTEDVEQARDMLIGEDGLFIDFEFADEASRAHAVALLLLPFVREFIGSGSTPLHAALAHDVGSGKTLLAQAALLPGCGLVPVTTGTGSEEEWRKKITALLLRAPGAVLLDNLSGELDSGSLAAALTSGTWSDRILGESREVSLEIRNTWAVTGNNLSLTREMTRRTVACFLDPGEVRPADRSPDEFAHPDLLGWAMENRRELVRAALTLIRHWLEGPVGLVEGGYVYLRTGEAPRHSETAKGSFGRWAGVIGGILEAAEIDGFLTNERELAASADEDTADAREFLAAWHAHTQESMEFKDIAAMCDFAEIRDYLPPDLLSLHGDDLRQALQPWLRDMHGSWRGGYRLEQVDGHRRLHWRVVKSTRGEAAVEPPPPAA
ncbi:MAG: hypothetical protein M3355_10820 [Actinomycetota bacterium]|nr:hypothetical protein [Actinomycetota bacterium]